MNIEIKDMIRIVEQRKHVEFTDWQKGDYEKGHRDALENLKLELAYMQGSKGRTIIDLTKSLWTTMKKGFARIARNK